MKIKTKILCGFLLAAIVAAATGGSAMLSLLTLSKTLNPAGHSPELTQQAMATATQRLVIVVCLGIAATLIVGFSVAGSISRRLQKFFRVAEAIAKARQPSPAPAA